MYGIITLILIVVGFLYQELIIILPIAFIYFILWKYKKPGDPNFISYLICVSLLIIVSYCQFLNGIFSMKATDYFKVYREASYHHEYFPLKVVSFKDKYNIKSIELGMRWKEKAFQETIWFDRDQLIYSHDNCGFGEMCPVEFKYGTI